MILCTFMIYIYLESYLSKFIGSFSSTQLLSFSFLSTRKLQGFLNPFSWKNLHPGFHYSFLLLLPFFYFSSNLLALTRKPSQFGVGMWNTFTSLLHEDWILVPNIPIRKSLHRWRGSWIPA